MAMSKSNVGHGAGGWAGFGRWWTLNAEQLAWMAVLIGGAAVAVFLMRG